MVLYAQEEIATLPDTAAISTSLKTLGLHFDSDELMQMGRSIKRNVSVYQAIREYPVSNAVSPALLFNPLPVSFTPLPDEGLNNWSIIDTERPVLDKDIAFMTIPELAGLIKSQQITSTELTLLYIKRLKEYDDTLRCVVNLTEELAIQQAARADEEISRGLYRGILHGIPYGVKDLLSWPGYPTTWGAFPYQDQMLNQNATVIR